MKRSESRENHSKLLEVQQMWNRQLAHKMEEIENSLVHQRVQDYRMANGKANNPSVIKGSQRPNKKRSKFNRLQLSLNKARLEMENFEKNSMLFEKEKRREDLVLMATQQTVMEETLRAKATQFDPSKKHKRKHKSINSSQSTFHKYKCKVISAEQIISPLRKYLLQKNEGSDLDSEGIDELDKSEEQCSRIDTQRVIEKEVRAFRRIQDSIIQEEELENMMDQGNQAKDKRVVTIAGNKNVSALGLVKYFSIDDLQQQDEQSKSAHFHMTFHKTNEVPVFPSKSTDNPAKNFLMQFEQRLDHKKSTILQKADGTSNLLQSQLQSQAYSSLQSPIAISTLRVSDVFKDKRSSHQPFSQNNNHRALMLPRIQVARSRNLVGTKTTLNDSAVTASLQLNLSSLNLSHANKGLEIRSKYLNGVSSLPQIGGFRANTLYQKLSNIVNNLNDIKDDKVSTLHHQSISGSSALQ